MMPSLWVLNDPKGASVRENTLRFHLLFRAGGRRGKLNDLLVIWQRKPTGQLRDAEMSAPMWFLRQPILKWENQSDLQMSSKALFMVVFRVTISKALGISPDPFVDWMCPGIDLFRSSPAWKSNEKSCESTHHPGEYDLYSYENLQPDTLLNLTLWSIFWI